MFNRVNISVFVAVALVAGMMGYSIGTRTRNGLPITDIHKIKMIGDGANDGSVAFFQAMQNNVYVGWVKSGSNEPTLYQVPRGMFRDFDAPYVAPAVNLGIVKAGNPYNPDDLDVGFYPTFSPPKRAAAGNSSCQF